MKRKFDQKCIDILVKAYLDGKSYKEIAEEIRVKTGKVFSTKSLRDKVSYLKLAEFKRIKNGAVTAQIMKGISQEKKSLDVNLQNLDPAKQVIRVIYDFELLIDYILECIQRRRLSPGFANALVSALKSKAEIILKIAELSLEKQKQLTPAIQTWVDLINKAKNADQEDLGYEKRNQA